MADVEVDVSHAAISRALASLGERAGGVEVASALRGGWEPFEAQMRRRMRCRAPESRAAYHCLASAGGEKVRFHLEATGVLPRSKVAKRRRPGIVIRVRDGRSQERLLRRIGQRCDGGQQLGAGDASEVSRSRRPDRCGGRS